MTAGDPRGRLAAWRSAAAQAVEPALDEAAEALAAEARRTLAGTGDPRVTVAAGRDADRQATVTVQGPGILAREFGSFRTAARPVLRPAAAALRAELGRRIIAALHHALSPRGSR